VEDRDVRPVDHVEPLALGGRARAEEHDPAVVQRDRSLEIRLQALRVVASVEQPQPGGGRQREREDLRPHVGDDERVVLHDPQPRRRPDDRRRGPDMRPDRIAVEPQRPPVHDERPQPRIGDGSHAAHPRTPLTTTDRRRTVLAMHRTILLAVLCACTAKDDATDTGADGDADTDSDSDTDTDTEPAYPATWDGVQSLFADHCFSCHPATNDIDLVPLIEEDLAGPRYYVVPGSAEDSRLWLLVTGGTLYNMPPPNALLPAATVEPIREWIDAGASLE
jgi:hypothetical protein